MEEDGGPTFERQSRMKKSLLKLLAILLFLLSREYSENVYKSFDGVFLLLRAIGWLVYVKVISLKKNFYEERLISILYQFKFPNTEIGFSIFKNKFIQHTYLFSLK